MEITCERLMELGVDVSGAVERLGGNELKYLTICGKFLNDPNYRSLQEALSQENYMDALRFLHTLKGVTANLGFQSLEASCILLQSDIREKEKINLIRDNDHLKEEYCLIISVLKGDIVNECAN